MASALTWQPQKTRDELLAEEWEREIETLRKRYPVASKEFDDEADPEKRDFVVNARGEAVEKRKQSEIDAFAAEMSETPAQRRARRQQDAVDSFADELERPEMGVGRHAVRSVESATGKSANRILPGGLLGETGKSILLHAAPFAMQAAKMDSNREVVNLEKLRTGNYNDVDFADVADAAGLKYDRSEFERSVAADPVKSRSERLGEWRRLVFAELAEQELLKRGKVGQQASRELENSEQTTMQTIGSGMVENSGYTLGFALSTAMGGLPAAIAVPGAVSAGDRIMEGRTKSYSVDRNGGLVVEDNRDTELVNALKGVAGGALEAGVEVGLETGLGWAMKGLGKLTGAQNWLVPGLRKIGSAMRSNPYILDNAAGRCLVGLGKGYNAIAGFTQLHSAPMELLEEDVQAFVDDVCGVGKRDAEWEGWREEWRKYKDDTLSARRQYEIFLGLVGTMAVQGAAGGLINARSNAQHNKTRQRLDGVMALHNILTEDEMRTLSPARKALFERFYGLMARGRDAESLQNLAGHFDEHVQKVVGRMVERASSVNRTLEERGVAPREFEIPTDEAGNAVFQPTLVTGLDGTVRKARMAVDAESGVSITDLGDGSYEVRNPRTGESAVEPDLGTAKRAADMVINRNKALDLDNEAKADYVEGLANTKYRGAKIEVVDSMQTLVNKLGREEGIDLTKVPAFNPNKSGLRHGGKVYLVLDNLPTTGAIDTVMHHEIVGHHEGTREDGFIDRVGDDTEVADTKRRIDWSRGGETDERRKAYEAFAYTIQRRQHSPSFAQKLERLGRQFVRRVWKPDMKMTDAEIETVVAGWEKKLRNGTGGSFGKTLETPFRERTEPDYETIEGEKEPDFGGGPAETATKPEEAEAAPAASEPSRGEPKGAEGSILDKMQKAIPITTVNPQEVNGSDDRIPNFKRGANSRTGITTPLSGEPKDILSNPIVVMEFKDGEQHVVTGRHRLELYQRYGRTEIPARVLKEADGWTVRDAEHLDAVSNILDGQGTVEDYVKFLDSAKLSRTEAEKDGILRGRGLTAWNIHSYAIPGLRAAVDYGDSTDENTVTPEQAGIIAENAPKDEDKINSGVQSAAMKAVFKKPNIKPLALKGLVQRYRQIAQDAAKSGAKKDGLVQGDLFAAFGVDTTALDLVAKEEEYKEQRAAEYRRIAKDIRDSKNSGGRLKISRSFADELGIPQNADRKQLESAAQKALQRAAEWGLIQLKPEDQETMYAALGHKRQAQGAEATTGKATAKEEETPAPKVESAKTVSKEKSPEAAAKPAPAESVKPTERKAPPQEPKKTETGRAQAERPKEPGPVEAAKPATPVAKPAPKKAVQRPPKKAVAPEGDAAASKTEVKAVQTPNPASSTGSRGGANFSADDAKAFADIASDFWSDPALDAQVEESRPAPKSEHTDEERATHNLQVGAKLVKLFADRGGTSFQAFAETLKKISPQAYETARDYLPGVWTNAVMARDELEEMTKSQYRAALDAVDGMKFAEPEKSAERTTPAATPEKGKGEEDGRLGRTGDPDGQGAGAHDGVPAEGRAENGEGGDAGEDGPRQGDAGAEGGLPGGREVGGPAEQVGAGARGADTSAGGEGAVREGEGLAGGEGAEGVAEDAGRKDGADGEGAPAPEPGVGVQPEAPGTDGAKPGGADVAAAAAQSLGENAPNAAKEKNYVLTSEDEKAIESMKPVERAENNLKAIRILRELESADRSATPEEKRQLARFSGWGGCSQIFDRIYEYAQSLEARGATVPPRFNPAKAKFGQRGYAIYRELCDLLSESELFSAKTSTLTAFYTPPRLARLMHETLKGAGVDGGRFLESSAGKGDMIGTQPSYGKRVNWTAVEIDPITGGILKALYPEARTFIEPFQKTRAPDGFFDAFITNVPYADIAPADKQYDRHGFMLHDYFFAKGIDKLRVGGVAALLTSTGTLDKRDKKLIHYLSDHGGKIVGAVRLPNGTFSKNAGTEVACDLIFIQKVDGAADNSGFARNGKVMGVNINECFIAHPEWLACDLVQTVSTRYGVEPALEFRDAGFERVRKAVLAAAKELKYTPREHQAPTRAERETMVDEKGLAEGNLDVVDGKIFRKENGVMVPVTIAVRGAKAVDIVKSAVPVRSAYRAVVDVMVKGGSDEDLKKAQADLNHSYDLFVAKHGFMNQPAVASVLSNDWESGTKLLALEKWNSDRKSATKTDVFTKRTIRRSLTVEHVDSVMDGLRVSLNVSGTASIPYIAKLAGVDEAAAEKELVEKGMVFRNPESGDFETSDEYLSGTVRRKLLVAEAAAKLDPQFERNVEALKGVIPADIPADQIKFRIGQSWVPVEDYNAFMGEVVYGLEGWGRVSYEEASNSWKVDPRNRYVATRFDGCAVATSTIIEDLMNGKPTRVMSRMPDGSSVLNETETNKARLVQKKVQDAFSKWCLGDPARAARMKDLYNFAMNDNVPRKFDVGILSLDGLSEKWRENLKTPGREYQKRAIARGVFGGNLLLAHTVGAGKTVEMASIAMELRRLGIAKKPMFVVPNHMLKQWATEFVQTFPTANVLMATPKDLSKDNRKKFMARVTNGDWDAVVVAHTSFKSIGMSPAFVEEYINREIRDLENAISVAKEEGGSRQTVKQMQKRLEKLKEKLQKLLDTASKDVGVNFDELGVDYLFVDEAHNFKGLQINTHLSNVAGVTGAASQKAQDMEMKCQFVQKLHAGKRGVVFATGTPISNSVSEMYVMMRYLASRQMSEMGIRSFDDWARQFGDIVTAFEMNPSGKGWREKQRFAQFINVPELTDFFRSFADVVMSKDIKVKRPNLKTGKKIIHEIEPSKTILDYIDSLADRAERIKSEKIDPAEDNLLKITTEGRLLALDPRLIGVQDPSGERVRRCADEVLRVYNETADTQVEDEEGHLMALKGAQLIFCDSGVPKRLKKNEVPAKPGAAAETESESDTSDDMMLRGQFNLYADMRDRLVNRGIPAGEIAFIHDYNTPEAKQELFEKVRNGEIRILIGNTAKMGEGTNVQRRLVALHHLDVPWKPAWIEQRDGRIIRPGNLNSEVEIHHYITKKTFDVYSWQTVTRKAKFIETAMTGGNGARTIEDGDSSALTAEEITALATGDPRVLEHMTIRREIERMQEEIDAAKDAEDAAKRRLGMAESEYVQQQRRISDLAAAVESFNKARAGRDLVFEKPDGTELKDNAETVQYFGAKINEAMAKGTSAVMLGKIFGLGVRFEHNRGEAPRVRILELKVDHELDYGGLMAIFNTKDLGVIKGDITRMTKGGGEGVMQALEGYRRAVENTRIALESTRADPKMVEELAGKKARFAQLSEELGLGAKKGGTAEEGAADGESMEDRARDEDAEWYDPALDPDGGKLKSFTNANVKAWRKAYGMPRLRDGRPVQFDKLVRDARGRNPEVVKRLIDVVNRTPQVISAEDEVAIAERVMELTKRYADLTSLVNDAVDRGNESEANELRRQRDSVEATLTEAMAANKKAGTEIGRALLARRVLFNGDGTFGGFIAEAKSDVGRELTEEERKHAKMLWDAYEGAGGKADDAVVRRTAEILKELVRKRIVKDAASDFVEKPKDMVTVEREYRAAIDHVAVHAVRTGGSLVGLPGGRKWMAALCNYHIAMGLAVGHRPTVDELLVKIRNDLNGYVRTDDYTILQLMTSYGNTHTPDDSALGKTLRETRELMRDMLKLRDIASGESPKKTGYIRDVPTAEMRESGRRVREAYEELLRLRPELSEENSNRRLRSVRDARMRQMQNEIDDLQRAIESGERLNRERHGISYTPEMEAKRRELEEKRREYARVFPKEGVSEEQKIDRLVKYLKRLKKEKEGLLLSLRNAADRDEMAKIVDGKPKAAPLVSERITELRNEIAGIQDEIDTIVESTFPVGTPEQLAKMVDTRIRRLQKATQDIQMKLIQNDLSPMRRQSEVSKAVNQDPEVVRLLAVKAQAMKKLQAERRKFRDSVRPMAGGIRALQQINAFSRAFKTMLDLSATFVQGNALMVSHPVLGAKAFKEQLLATFSQDRADQIQAGLNADDDYGEFVKLGGKAYQFSSLGDADTPEEFRDSDVPLVSIGGKDYAISDIPVVKAAERSFGVFLTTLAVSNYKAMKSSNGFGPTGPTEDQKRDLVRFINVALGYGYQDTSKGGLWDDITKLAMWAPRLVVANFKMATALPVVLRPFFSGNINEYTWEQRRGVAKLVGREYARSLAAMAAFGLILTLMVGRKDPDYLEEVLDPRSDEFLNVRTGNRVLNTFGGITQWWRLLSRLVTGETRRSGVVKDARRSELVAKFLRNKLSPMLALGGNLVSGEDFGGDPYSVGKALRDFACPISVEDLYKEFSDNSLGYAVLNIVPVITGLAKGSYEFDEYTKATGPFIQEANRAAKLMKEGSRREAEAIRKGNPLFRHEKTIRRRMAEVRKLETQIKDLKENGREPSEALLKRLEAEQRGLVEFIRRKRK